MCYLGKEMDTANPGMLGLTLLTVSIHIIFISWWKGLLNQKEEPTKWGNRVQFLLEEGLEKGLQRGSREGALLVVKFYVQFQIWSNNLDKMVNK